MNEFARKHIGTIISLILTLFFLFLFAGKRYVDAKNIETKNEIKTDVINKFDTIIVKLDKINGNTSGTEKIHNRTERSH